MGCVSLSERFFRDGKISAKRIERARLAARLELEPVQAAFRRRGWEHSAGSSGTVRAIGEAIRALDPQALTITAAGLARAINYSVDAGHIRELSLEPITEDRRPVFPGGSRSSPRSSAARRGGDADRGRRDARGPAVRHGRPLQARGCARAHRARHAAALPRRHRAGRARRGHGARFLEQVRETWKLEEPLADLALKWAARLHEIGLDVSHSGYHRHGAYLLENADMPGFPREEQRLLARLVGAPSPQAQLDRHRGAGSALGPRGAPDRAAAPGGAAAPGPQRHGAAADRAGRHAALAGSALPGALASRITRSPPPTCSRRWITCACRGFGCGSLAAAAARNS